MDVEKEMNIYGFEANPSGGSCMWYTKPIKYEGKDAFIAVTDEDGMGLPESLEDPVLIGVYDKDTGEELQIVEWEGSLKSYLESLSR